MCNICYGEINLPELVLGNPLARSKVVGADRVAGALLGADVVIPLL